MGKKVFLKCQKNHVSHEVEVDKPRQYGTRNEKDADKAARGWWYVILTVTDEKHKRQFYAFIDINSQGQFAGYSVIDEVSGMEFHADPDTFTEAFTSFISECVEISTQHSEYLKAVGM